MNVADAIATVMRNSGQTQVWGAGQVTAVAAPVVTVSWLGDTFDMHYLTSYSPSVNDIVLLLVGGDQLIVLGKISS